MSERCKETIDQSATTFDRLSVQWPCTTHRTLMTDRPVPSAYLVIDSEVERQEVVVGRVLGRARYPRRHEVESTEDHVGDGERHQAQPHRSLHSVHRTTHTRSAAAHLAASFCPTADTATNGMSTLFIHTAVMHQCAVLTTLQRPIEITS